MTPEVKSIPDNSDLTPAAAGLSADHRVRLEQATRWLTRVQENPAVADRPDYLAWMSDAENRRSLDEIQAGWDAVDAYAASPEFMALRSRALEQARRRAGRRWRPHFGFARGAAAAAVIGIALAGAFYFYASKSVQYVTEIGERRIVTLDDGSRLSLDADSRVSVHYTRAQRRLELDRGRARFEVTHNTARPFTVRADAETVLAVGTNFDVERLGDKVVVTLIQGRVLVSEPETPAHGQTPHSVKLEAGQRLVAGRGAPFFVSPADLRTASSWENARLDFNDEPLSDVVVRINRYTRLPVSVSPQAGALRISGIFRAGDADGFVDAITNYLPLDAVTTSEGILLRTRGHQ